MNDAFGITTELEPQPHGGALKRSHDMTEPTVSRAQQYENERMATVPALYKTTHERLAVELALRMEDPEVIFQRYGYTPEQADALMETASFTILLARIGKEIAENGLSFKAKIRAIAEDLLPTAHALATDALTSSSVRADIIKWAAKMAGHEPKEAKDDGRSGGGLNLSITFAGQAPMKVVQNEPITLEAS